MKNKEHKRYILQMLVNDYWKKRIFDRNLSIF